MRCPKCKNESAWKSHKATRTILGVKIVAKGSRCKCGKVVYDAAQSRQIDRDVAGALVERGIRAGQELKFVRKVAGIRATELAEMLGVTAKTVSRWETGEVPIPRAMAYVVADLYEHPRRTQRRLAALS